MTCADPQDGLYIDEHAVAHIVDPYRQITTWPLKAGRLVLRMTDDGDGREMSDAYLGHFVRYSTPRELANALGTQLFKTHGDFDFRCRELGHPVGEDQS